MRPTIAIVLLLLISSAVLATTWGEQVVKCPICGTKNTFQAPMSYGSYIYMWPSKFQLIFWPDTEGVSLYHCKKCHYSAFMRDFQVPEEKRDAIRTVLKEVKLTYDTGDYSTIPMFERLELAEKIYGSLQRDDEFWCHFYRVKAYHLQAEKKQPEADAARKKALDLAVKLAADGKRAGEKKHFLVIVAAMKHYLKNDPDALEDLERAATLKFEASGLKPEQNKNYDEYLSMLIKDYLQAIREGRNTDGERSGEL